MIAATNRIDILDPALLRSGRLDRKIEFPAPTEEARARIMQIHARYMRTSVADPHLLLCGFGSGSRIQKMSIWIRIRILGVTGIRLKKKN